MAERVLVVAPHPDDEAIGCGGTLCLHHDRSDPIHIAFLTSGERGMPGTPEETVRSIREAEAEEAGKVLKVDGMDFLRLPDMNLDDNIEMGGEALRKIIEARTPDLVYLPHPDESHPDHEAVLPIVRCALVGVSRKNSGLPELRAYEVWTPMVRYGWVEDISDVMPRKLRAVRCYRSQTQLIPYDRAVRGLNRYRGIMAAGSRYAEAFQYVDPHLPDCGR